MRLNILKAFLSLQLAMAALSGAVGAAIIHHRFTSPPQFRLGQPVHIAIGTGEVSTGPNPPGVPQLALEGHEADIVPDIKSYGYLKAAVTPSGMLSPTLVEAGTVISAGTLGMDGGHIRRPPLKLYKTYLGFSFPNEGKTNYGWLAVNVYGGAPMSPKMMTLESMAYEDSGAPIAAGAMPPAATELSISGPGELSWLSAPNLSYRLEISTDCVSWTDSGMSASGTGEIIKVAAPHQGPRSFYRLRVGVRQGGEGQPSP